MTEMSYEPLTPTAHLERAASAHRDRVAVVDGDLRLTYGELHARCRRVAGGLAALADGRPVAVLATNSHVMLEAHFAVPWAGVPLVALNIRLAPAELTHIVRHSDATVLLYEAEFAPVARSIAAELPGLRLVEAGGADDEYASLAMSATPLATRPTDERALLALNYTSGTTGRPKGVMYHHRGAYLQALSQVAHAGLDPSSVFLWTLPMFHCNGWGYPWAVTAAGGRHVCLRKVDPGEVWRLIAAEGVTHLNAAPTVLTMLAHDPAAAPVESLRVQTGGAPPSPALLEKAAALGIEITHLYGLTETFGPSIVCDWRPEWDALPASEQARLKARQGVRTYTTDGLRVLDADGAEVPADATATGEIAVRGNTVMLGYYKDPEATAAAAPDGWFRTGDLAVRHPDGYVELRDRSKDVIISGGENIASVEVEQAIASHPAVLEAAVVAVPDEKWGEVPAAYVTLAPGAEVTAEEIVEHVRTRLARFKAPRHVVFTDLPKTATGKIQKFVLRERARGH
ncbi:AMP-binding protein [Actinophytocola oryzae]|uniref:Fatty-acyl-CoA synthase n=1 Tax=Actinophytocola oryzae TaxID=502181 RepID=A0A4R7W847_9PSEU|nr:AMP-binding protein [Actinophytocola oryzae]TDV57867.1 fatty-acyl-CoA synthase [Actinophytocola oryzae]